MDRLKTAIVTVRSITSRNLLNATAEGHGHLDPKGWLGGFVYAIKSNVFQPIDYRLRAWLFLRLFGLIYLAAFASFGVQALGLIGSQGILPLADFLRQANESLGSDAYWRIPTVFWIDASDLSLRIVCIMGVLCSLLLICGIAQTFSLAALYALYLSLFYAGQVFMSFQWDLLLLETGFLAIFLTTRMGAILWLYRWLLFRFMFLSGCVKLLSGDPTWANLTALHYHFETQPLPLWTAWYVHQLPDVFLRCTVAVTFIIELLVPFMFFLPRRPRLIAAWSTLLLEFTILITGNYNFFNLLTMLLCIFLFDEKDVKRVLPRRLTERVSSGLVETQSTVLKTFAVSGLCGIILLGSVLQIPARSSDNGLLTPLYSVMSLIEPLYIVNSYGLFAVMTTTRPEIIVEGSDDMRTWLAYEFCYKPGDPKRRPSLNIPHQPRLDWQMWFAALGEHSRNPWFSNLLYRLLQNAPHVTALLEHNPFPDKPPRYVRAQVYQYRYASPDVRRLTGQWWERRLEGMYYPVVSLDRS